MSGSLDELLRKLDSIGGDVEKSALKGLHKAAQKIQADAKRLAPAKDGRLRNSITAESHMEGGDIVATAGTILSYAPYVEFGTGPTGEASKKFKPDNLNLEYRDDGWVYHNGESFVYTEGQPAKPFLYPAFKQNEQYVTGYISDSIKADIRAGMNDGG